MYLSNSDELTQVLDYNGYIGLQKRRLLYDYLSVTDIRLYVNRSCK